MTTGLSKYDLIEKGGSFSYAVAYHRLQGSYENLE